jgi:D-amino peptidase
MSRVKYISILRTLFLWLPFGILFAKNGDSKPRKVFIDADGEGMAGIFHVTTQVMPITAPRYLESRKLMTGEVNAAIAGLFDGGAEIVDVADYHSGSNTLAPLDLDPRALVGAGRGPVMGLDSSYSAYAFIAFHSMAGTEKGMIAHGYSWTEYQNIWVNNVLRGELGIRTMLAGHFGIPVIMVSGDEAVCKELHGLVPNAECAVVKWGVNRTFGYSLSHPASCEVIRKAAQRAMERLPEIKPYILGGPVEIKVELTPEGMESQHYLPGNGIEQVTSTTWVFRGKNIVDAFLKFIPGF